MISVEIPKNRWLEMVNWCLTNLKHDVEFQDGAVPVLVFESQKERFLFAVKWGL